MLKMLAAILLSTVLSGCEATSKEPSPQTLEKIENITQDDLLSSEEKIRELQQLASHLSYEYGTGNGEYHDTYDTQAVFEAIEELKAEH